MNLAKKISLAQWLLDPDKNRKFPSDWKVLEKLLSDNNLLGILNNIELPLVEILDEMRRVGIKVDRSLLKKLSRQFGDDIIALEKSIYKIAGREFNINSPKQLSEILFLKPPAGLGIVDRGVSKTKSGLRSTDFDVLSFIKERYPVADLLLKYREAFKTKSTYLDPLLEWADDSGRVHTEFLQAGAATGRFSSRNPNLQNIPPQVRQVFVAEDGHQLVSFDYSQIELRVLASVSGDPKMIDAFKRDLDIHVLTASQVFNVDIKKVSKEQRQLAKTLNFGVIYGMGPNAFARASGLSRDEAAAFIAEYFSDFSGVSVWQKDVLEKARQMGYVENLSGRKRWLPDIVSFNRRSVGEAERAALNMPIQGLAADILKMAMINVAGGLKKKKWWMNKVRLLLTIHDELLFEVRDDILKETIDMIRLIMESAYELSVPLRVDVAQGKNWGDI